MGKQNRELIKNMERYEQEEKAKQQKSQIFGQKPVKGRANKDKKINV